MKTFKKILVPVDFSAHSAEAIRHAADLSRRYDASVSIVHVYQSMEFALPGGFPAYEPARLKELLQALTAQVESSVNDAHAAGALKVDGKLLQGTIAHEIVTCAKQGNFDLIVIGTHGRSGLGHLLLGSIAEKVLRTAPCPVLTVRATPA
jgi:nucleotide-binding universal stress UspA family protein